MDIAKQVTEKASAVEKRIEQRLTILWHEIEEWQQDNHFITSGYRPASGSYKKSASSIGYIHNETVNIWTHLLGAIAAITGSFILYSVLEPRYETATKDDVVVFSCFFLGAAACLSLSATFHTISNHSHAVASFGNKLDYLGIVFLIWGSFIPSIYYGFGEDVKLIKFYWAMITTIGCGCAIVSVNSKFRTPALRPFRAAMFVAMGLSAVVPVFHGMKLFGISKLTKTIGLPWLVLQGVLYIAGATIYAMRIPERWAPGKFDIWGSSHQIFHVLVLLAAISHLVGLIKAFDHEHSSRIDLGYPKVMQMLWR